MLISQSAYENKAMDQLEADYGKNGMQKIITTCGNIFMDAAGHRWNGNLSNAGSRGYYWSSTQHPSDSNRAYDLYLCPNDAYGYYYSLGSGHAVRPVSK